MQQRRLRQALQRALLTAVALLVGTLALASCSEREVTSRDLVGEWRGAGDTVLILQHNHRFTCHKLPLQLANPDDYSSPVSAQGSWSIYRDTGGAPWLDLSIGSHGVTFIIGYENGEWITFFYIGDPDAGKRYIFHRRD